MKILQAIMFLIFWDILMVEQILLLPQVKRSVKISWKTEKLNFSRSALFPWKLEFVSNNLWMVVDKFDYAEFDGAVCLYCFGPEVVFFCIFDPKNQSLSFKITLGA